MEASDKGEPASKRGRKIGKGYKGDDFKTKKKSKSPTRKKSKSPTRPKKPKSLTGGNNDDDYIPRTPTRQRKKIIINSRSSLDRGSSHSLEEFHANKSPKSPKKKKAAAGQIRKPKIALLEESRSRMSFRKGPSVTKTLTALLKTPSNRSCADCRSALVDPSEIHASFCPSGKEIHLTPEIAVAFHDFQITHQAFAPPDVKGDPIKFGADPAMFVNQRFGGHGVFICAKCAEAHKRLGKTITVVHHLQDPSVWTNDHAEFMKKGGGNARSWLVYEAYLPEGWKKRRPNPSSLLQDRLIFCRAKYEALAFTMPPPGPLSEIAWLSILERNNSVKRFAAGELRNIHNLTPTYTTSQKGTESGTTRKLPNRLIDFFCVVNSSMQLHPHALEKDLSTLNAPEELMFWPQVCDCFPIRTAHDDMEFPEHLPSFVLPDGCHPSTTQKPPTFFTFVLTLGDGDRLYGGALHIHDETTEMDDLYKMVKGSGYEGPLPRFLTEADEDQSDIVFFPKCLVILSHHPFFDLFREFLQQIYRITFVEAPLPIERYIANIACEVPLPPQGEIKVEFGFTTDRIITIQRPPVNRLPLANFSFRPLFASLSVGNILVVLGCLLQECKVALMSQYYSILCPTTEALLSALFPFEWQGLYIVSFFW